VTERDRIGEFKEVAELLPHDPVVQFGLAAAYLEAGQLPIQVRVGLNSGEVVVRSVGSDLHIDYTAVGQTTHLAARMEQIAMACSIMMTAKGDVNAHGYRQDTADRVKHLGGRKGTHRPPDRSA
jgi:hypothetical protein